MALGTIAGSLIGGLASAGASYGLGKLFSGSQPDYNAALSAFRPPGISSGGLMTRRRGGGIEVTASPERSALVGDIGQTYLDAANELSALRSLVTPGASALRESRLQQIENARESAISNLRENLQRRRILGSSFASDALSRAEAEFGQQKERVAAESFLQALELNNRLLQQETTARANQFQTGLSELNLQADIALKLANNASGIMAQNARTMAELDARAAQGAGSFFGSQVIQPISSGIRDFFRPSSQVAVSSPGWIGNTGFPGWLQPA